MDKCGICLKPAVQLFETGKDGVYACFRCQPLVPEVTISDAMEHAQASGSIVEVEVEVESAKNNDEEMVEATTEGNFCGICNKTFAKNSQLQAHLRNHRAERRFVCMYCNKAFSQSNNLRAHLRIHTNERPYKCSECDKAFTQVTNLNNHMRLHTGERPFICPEPGCNKAYAQVTNLNQHRKRHLNGRLVEASYDCPVCGQRFDQRNHMYNHRREAHAEVRNPAPSRKYICQLCDAALPSDKQLQAHVAAHAVNDKRSERDSTDDSTDKTELSCVFRACGARFSSPHEHTEHLLQAHQLRVLANSAPAPQARRGRPPKVAPESSHSVDVDLTTPTFDFVSVEKVKVKPQPKPIILNKKNFQPIKIINATKYFPDFKITGMP